MVDSWFKVVKLDNLLSYGKCTAETQTVMPESLHTFRGQTYAVRNDINTFPTYKNIFRRRHSIGDYSIISRRCISSNTDRGSPSEKFPGRAHLLALWYHKTWCPLIYFVELHQIHLVDCGVLAANKDELKTTDQCSCWNRNSRHAEAYME